MVLLYVDGVLGLVLIGFLLFCLLDVITSSPREVRNLPKVAWMLLVFINPVGGVAWLLAGRPKVSDRANGLSPLPNQVSPGRPRPQGPSLTPPERERPRRAVGPDDDPDFIADLRKNASDHERMLGSWEDDLRRREDELRREGRKDGGDQHKDSGHPDPPTEPV
ncbi:MAG: PLDc N-terminal domain-containing protein [Mycobacteriales bacterium]